MDTLWASRVVFAICFLTHGALAFSVFDQRCESIPDNINYVSSAPYRGTMDIIWSCFAVLVACTWSVQHLPVPFDNGVRTRRSFWLTTFKRVFRFFDFNQLKWMGLTLIAPEYTLGKAVAEFLAAHHARRQFINYPWWTLKHGYFANMRGFVMRFQIAAVPTSIMTSKATPLGLEVTNARPDPEIPYYEQSVERSREIELQQCREICGIPCRNRDFDVEDEKASRAPSSTGQSPSPSLSKQNRDEELGREMHRSVTAKTAPALTRYKTADREIYRSVTAKSDTALARFNTADISYLPDGSENLPNPLDDIQPISHQETDDGSFLHPHKPWQGVWALTSNQWAYAVEAGIIPEPPRVNVEEIDDKSKGDALVKALAIGQVSWLVIQIIARATQDLAITLLEITVVAFSSSAVFIYLFLWEKPQDVKMPIYVDTPNVLTREQIIGLAARSPASSLIVNEFWLHGVAIRAMGDSIFPTTPGLSVKMPWWTERHLIRINPILVGMGLGGSLFGIIHVTAWNFNFPTPIERVLWRVASLLVCVLPLFMTTIYWMGQRVGKMQHVNDVKINKVLKPCGYALIPLYLLARLYLIVEMFRALAYPVPSTFSGVDWWTVIPHIN